MDHAVKVEPAFVLKGSLFTLSVLQLLDPDPRKLDRELGEKIRLAPKFFHYAPVVMDLSKLDSQNSQGLVDFEAFKQVIRAHKLVPVGIRGGSVEAHRAAQEAGFAVMIEPGNQNERSQPSLANKKTVTCETTPPSANDQPKEIPNSNRKMGTTLITSPIRSGQQVYAQGGDLVVVSSVSPGAELLADGNIHVYGTLRGRALAGINGDVKARVFCHKLQADLVAIAGHYKVFEDVRADDDDFYKQLYLQDGQLCIGSL